MKIRLLYDIPVNEKHKLTKDKIVETTTPPSGKENLPGVWVSGDREKVRILESEYDII